MGQGFAYARENNGTREVVVKDSTGKDIAMSAFSGYLAFSSNLLEQGGKIYFRVLRSFV